MKSDTLNLETRPLLYEVFSPPRIVRHLAAIAGSVKGCKNGDLLTGQDFSERKVQHVWVQDIYDRQPFFLMASPPCTHLSALAYSNWTKKKMDKATKELECNLGHVDFTVWLCQAMLEMNGFFCIENPQPSLLFRRENAASRNLSCQRVARAWIAFCKELKVDLQPRFGPWMRWR